MMASQMQQPGGRRSSDKGLGTVPCISTNADKTGRATLPQAWERTLSTCSDSRLHLHLTGQQLPERRVVQEGRGRLSAADST